MWQVYRHNGFYFVYPVYHDSSPAELGAQVASEVPDVQSGKETFTVWVKKRRKDLQNLLDMWQNGDLQGMPVNLKIQREIPTNDLFIEWIYTIDFDNLVFCVDSKPLYDLANMPTGEDFVNYIGKLIFPSSQNVYIIHRIKVRITTACAVLPWTCPNNTVSSGGLSRSSLMTNR